MPRDAALAARIAARHGLQPGPVTDPDWPGVDNHVYVVGAGEHRHVVRFPGDPRAETDFAAEEWCLAAARRQGIPGPAVVARGHLGDGPDVVPYIVLDFIEGTTGEVAQHVGGSAPLWFTLGEYARIISRVPLGPDAPAALYSRFGRDLPFAWRSQLDYNSAMLTPEDPLLSLGVYDREGQRELAATIEVLHDAPLDFGLSHGDLALRNLIVPAKTTHDSGAPTLIDWGAASAGPVPYTDLMSLLRNSATLGTPDAADIIAFAQGFGVALDTLASTTIALQDLSAMDLVRWALEKRPDLVESLAATARARLSAPRPWPSPDSVTRVTAAG